MNAALLDLAGRFNLTKRSGGLVGTCPSCSYPDAFSARVGREGRPLLHCFNGCAWDVLHDTARAALGTDWTPPPRPDAGKALADEQARQDAAQRLWQRCQPCAGTAAELYLTRRAIGHVAGSSSLRFDRDSSRPGGTRCPALVAAVRDVSGALVGIHRTYLANDGRKAAADPPRASFGNLRGGVVRLDPCASELVIGEGIETSASAGLLLGLPAWAALSAGNLGTGLMLPPEVHSVVLVIDHDEPGQDAAAAAERRWLAEGRAVRLAMPDASGTDFNDLLQARTTGETTHG